MLILHQFKEHKGIQRLQYRFSLTNDSLRICVSFLFTRKIFVGLVTVRSFVWVEVPRFKGCSYLILRFQMKKRLCECYFQLPWLRINIINIKDTFYIVPACTAVIENLFGYISFFLLSFTRSTSSWT